MIDTAFIVAFIVLFLHVCTWEGMIFSFVSSKLKPLPDRIKKPLYNCPICMTPWWGSILILVASYFDIWHFRNIAHEIFVLFSAAGINTVLIYIINQGKALSKSLSDDYECSCTSKEKIKEDRLKRLEQYGAKGFLKNVIK